MDLCDGVRGVPVDVGQGRGTEWKSHGDEEDGGADGEAAAAVSTTGASSWSGRQERQN